MKQLVPALVGAALGAGALFLSDHPVARGFGLLALVLCGVAVLGAVPRGGRR